MAAWRRRGSVLVPGVEELFQFVATDLFSYCWPDSYRANADLSEQLGLLVHLERMGEVGSTRPTILGPPCVGQIEPA